MSNVYKTTKTPVGELVLIANENGLLAILWENDDPSRVRIPHGKRDDDNHLLIETERQLKEYFAGSRDSFDIPLDFVGTEFQKSVWIQLMQIPHGETVTYLDIAKNLGNKNASRAVGAAVGKNPISIIAPCHRVLGTSGALTGFAGGLAHKAFLLKLETSSEI